MLTSFARTRTAPREVNPTFRTAPPGLQFLRKLGSNFQNTGLEIEPRFPAKPLRRKSVPNLGRSWGESSLQPFGCKLVRPQLGQIQVASTAIHLHFLHGHRPRSRPNQIQNPKSKLQTARLDFGFWVLDGFGFWISDFGFWILDFGFRILDFGFWISDFGFWVLDQFSLRSLCGGPKRPRLDFGFWISDFGFWILDFGFRIVDFGFWILDVGFWILDFGFRILDFGFWVLDQFSLRSLCGGPKRPRLDFGFRILDFGFRILEFGFWILGLD